MEIKFPLKIPKNIAVIGTCACLYFSLGLENSEAKVTIENASLKPLAVHSQTTKEIVAQLNAKHYVKLTLDDALSEKVFERYLTNLDPQRYYLLQHQRLITLHFTSSMRKHLMTICQIHF